MASDKAKKKCCYSGIGGQAVLEGIMMKKGDEYAVAVRKPDGGIASTKNRFPGICPGLVLKEIPFVRGIFQFIDSLTLGMRTLNWSASFYDEEEERDQRYAENPRAEKKSSGKALEIFSTMLGIGMALLLFVFLPTFLTNLIPQVAGNPGLRAVIEGIIRICIFLLYLAVIGTMKDIRRLYGYHGAEHKCINCIESGHELTVDNVMRSSRFHRRCGTSFIILVMLISVVIFFFIHVESVPLRLLIRILMIPVIAGISYEVLRLAGRYDNLLIRIISAPGILVQHLTTREPDREMAEVAINAVEQVFDWRAYLEENFTSGRSESGSAMTETGR
ncbi:MAG: DUF1385 domain-containing protein [Lachnospiraceae bacterium]|nr:DUF1385 domain-containing protein [Lachnospiraceae bacterium]